MDEHDISRYFFLPTRSARAETMGKRSRRTGDSDRPLFGGSEGNFEGQNTLGRSKHVGTVSSSKDGTPGCEQAAHQYIDTCIHIHICIHIMEKKPGMLLSHKAA